MSVIVRLEGSDEPAEALELDDLVLSLVSPRAYAPGAPFTFTLELREGPLSLRAKTIGSKRREDGRFDVRARLMDLRRVDRERLAALRRARPD